MEAPRERGSHGEPSDTERVENGGNGDRDASGRSMEDPSERQF
jgi:hypothetical protein